MGIFVLLSKIPEPSTTFRVASNDRRGTCFSYYDHFLVVWDDGEKLKTIELSQKNIRKI